eukprot:gnl/MRDRNA2_/MRDRNA2_123424_c0_seq1.p1 gnl/MRDRNA2_/MRDRNA2_123424_c0~~gnl/MRDRNA2_/MRDRNA2_123424_c0_seq1.p1  ORF type:complete len:274 (+),score=25.59 gnl/MRDRNA2_/MRDRNA2_123424_c0_seq1:89-823(+)
MADYEERQPLTGSNDVWVKNAAKEVRIGFIRKVYGILTVQLILTTAIAAPIQRMGHTWVRTHQWMMGVSLVMTLITICAMSCCRDVTKQFPTNYLLLFTFTAFEGVLVGFVSAGYTGGSVLMCAGITALIFLCMTGYAWTTKTDFTGMGPYLFGAMCAMCAFGFVMCIMSWCGVYIPLMHKVYSGLGVLLFTFYIIYDTQLIMGEMGGHATSFSIDDYVFAALTLYLDIIQLFLHLLSLFGDRD